MTQSEESEAGIVSTTFDKVRKSLENITVLKSEVQRLSALKHDEVLLQAMFNLTRELLFLEVLLRCLGAMQAQAPTAYEPSRILLQ